VKLMSQALPAKNGTREVQIPARDVTLSGELNIPPNAAGVVLFAHGSGSSRHSPRNQFVARTIRNEGVGTLLFDLLTRDEEAIDAYTRHLRFDIGFLAHRLVNATYWLKGQFEQVRAGYFGASTGAAAALVAAAELGEIVGAVVSRGGRPDLAADSLPLVKAPTLLIVGGLDYPVIEMNRQAYANLRCEKDVEIVSGATHLFEEPGTLDQVAQLAAKWFQTHLHSSRHSARDHEIGDEYVEAKR
jgi:dienelactone hydrolase